MMVQTDWLDHKALQIIKGVAATPGDTYTAENPLQVVNLMGGKITLEDWSPNIPTIKGGGVWASSPISDGRTLLAAPVGNVTEKMSIRITDTSYLGIMTQMTALNQMVADCRDFWQLDYQIDPVYLMWYASCGAGPQYALISNIDLAPEYEQSPSPSIRVSINIEREPAWRGIPPGANPKVWTYGVNSSHAQYNVNTASLITGSDHLITAIINNKAEWSPTAYGLQTTLLTKNYMDIAASLVPGDAPALVEMVIDASGFPPANIYVGRSTKRYNGTGHDGINRSASLILNGGDALTIAKVNTGTSTSGILSNGSAVNYTIGRRTKTGVDGAWVNAATWGQSGANAIKLDRQMYRGTFAIFARAFNSSTLTGGAAATLADMRMRVLIEEFEDNNASQYLSSIALPEVNPPAMTAFSYSPLVYMGTVTLPLTTRAVQSLSGYGIQLQESNTNLRVTLQHQVDVATAARTWDVEDLVFIPIDECAAQVSLAYNTNGVNGTVLLDNTGYLTRGELRQSAVGYIVNPLTGGVAEEVRGQNIVLQPNTDQRLYFIMDQWHTGGLGSDLPYPVTIRLNIVPRWAGIRDQ